MMQCNDINELMMDFLYQELEEPRAEAFRVHVEGCSRCNAELASLERTRYALRELPEAEPPQSVTARLLHEAARRAPRAAPEDERQGFFAWLSGLFRPLVTHPAWTAAASLVVVVGVTGYLVATGKVDTKPQSAPARDSVDQVGPVAQTAPEPALTPTTSAAEPPTTGAVPGDAYKLQLESDPSGAQVTVDGRLAEDRSGRITSAEEQGYLEGSRGKAGGKRNAIYDPREIMGTETKRAEKGDEDAYWRPSEEGAKGEASAPRKNEAKPVDIAPRGGGSGVLAGADDDGADAFDDAEVEQSVSAGKPGATPPPEPAGNYRAEAERPVMPEPAAAPQAPAPVPTTTSKPAPPPARPRQVSVDDEENRDVTKKKAVADKAPARKDANKDGKDEKAEKAKQKTQAEKLYSDAKNAAMTGNCGLSQTLRRQIQKIDNDYYNRSVVKDSVFAPCDNKLRNLKNRERTKAPSEVRSIEPDRSPDEDAPSSPSDAAE